MWLGLIPMQSTLYASSNPWSKDVPERNNIPLMSYIALEMMRTSLHDFFCSWRQLVPTTQPTLNFSRT